jgi:hypothetical protein
MVKCLPRFPVVIIYIRKIPAPLLGHFCLKAIFKLGLKELAGMDPLYRCIYAVLWALVPWREQKYLTPRRQEKNKLQDCGFIGCGP